MPFNNEVNPGSRAVDTQQSTYPIGPITSGFPSGATGIPLLVASKLYVGDAVSFSLVAVPVSLDSVNISCNTVELLLVWYAPDQTTEINTSFYEIRSLNVYIGGTFPLASYISDRTKGAYVDIWIMGTNLTTGQGKLQSFSGSFSVSSKPIDKLRISEQAYGATPPVVDSPLMSGDGMVIPSFSSLLGAGQTSGVLVSACLFDTWVLALSGSGAGGIIRARGGFGARAGPPNFDPNGVQFTYVSPTLPAANFSEYIIGPFPPMTRPLVFYLTNIGNATATLGCRAWQTGS